MIERSYDYTDLSIWEVLARRMDKSINLAMASVLHIKV